MIDYATETIACRSKITGNYFGDNAIKDCGICDNCLRKKETTLTKEEFEKIHDHIVAIMNKKSMEAKDLLLQLTGIKKEKAWKVIDALQSENKITIDNKGLIRLK